MDNYYERLNQAFANWNGGGEPSLEQRVENLETEITQKQDILTFDTEPVENSENPVTSGGLFSKFERYATKAALDEKVDTSNFTADQARQDAIESELAEEIETNKNNISSLQDMQTSYMKLVYMHFFGQGSGTTSYRMTSTDFTAVDNAQQCGMYLITIINWSTTPTASVYIAYYSGGAPTYNALTKIGGADAQISIVENRLITYTGNGKIQIYAFQ